MPSYRFGPVILDAADGRLASSLAAAHAEKLRPACMCKPPEGVPMYVARLDDSHRIKRMPYTGSAHHPDCPSYEPPPELSGLGDVAGGAIREDIDAGLTTLQLDFSLSKTGSRAPPTASGDAASVRTDGSRLTLRAVVHYLWEQAELNRWVPAMAGKRSWYVVRKHLLLAAEDKAAKCAPLTDLLFIPEAFSVEHRTELEARRLARLAPIATAGAGGRKLLLLIGEVKAIEPARYGHKMTIKHLPDMIFLLADDLHRRMTTRFEHELALWGQDESTHLIVAATFGVNDAGIAGIEDLCLVPTSAHWIPVEHRADVQLLDALTQGSRRFTKALRYNLTRDIPLASVVLADTAPGPVALYLVPRDASEAYSQALDALRSGSELESWVWHTGKEPMPALPTFEPRER